MDKITSIRIIDGGHEVFYEDPGKNGGLSVVQVYDADIARRFSVEEIEANLDKLDAPLPSPPVDSGQAKEIAQAELQALAVKALPLLLLQATGKAGTKEATQLADLGIQADVLQKSIG